MFALNGVWSDRRERQRRPGDVAERESDENSSQDLGSHQRAPSSNSRRRAGYWWQESVPGYIAPAQRAGALGSWLPAVAPPGWLGGKIDVPARLPRRSRERALGARCRGFSAGAGVRVWDMIVLL